MAVSDFFESKSAEEYREALKLEPGDSNAPWGLANQLIALQSFDESRQIIEQAHARKLDNLGLRVDLYGLPFLRGDPSTMSEQEQWFAGKPEENFGFSLASDTEA